MTTATASERITFDRCSVVYAAQSQTINSIHVLVVMTEPLPCVQLAPGSLSIHTSWLVYSSPLWEPGCSQAHRWGAPWWPAHPHLEGGRQRERKLIQSDKEGGWITSHFHKWPLTDSLMWHKNTHKKRYAVELSMNPPERMHYTISDQYQFCSLFHWTLCFFFQNDDATLTWDSWCGVRVK